MATESKTTTQKFTIIAIVILFVTGVLLFLTRHQLMSEDSVPTGDRIWQVNITSQFDISEATGTLVVGLPIESARIKLVRQTITHPTLSIKRIVRKEKSSSDLTVIPQTKGKHTFNAELIIHSSDINRWINKSMKITKLDARQRAIYLDVESIANVDDPVVTESLNSIKAGVTDLSSLVFEIYQYVYEQVIISNNVNNQEITKILTTMRANSLDKTNTFIALCRASNIPARLVTGVLLRDTIEAKMLYWAEVFEDNAWQPYDLEFGYTGEMPANYLALAVNRESVVIYSEPVELVTTIDIEEKPAYAGMIGGARKELVQLIDLSRLSMDTQSLLSTILLLPFGALITVFFRLIIGIRTFGTFSATLLALAMVFADWITVTFIVGIVATISLAGLFYVAGQFSRVPRLAVVFTLVATSMAFGVSLMDYLNLNPSAGVILLPVVILTSLIDRIYTVTEEDGIKIMVRRFTYTVIVALVCYLVFRMEWLGQFIILHPEIHLFTLAFILSISLYKRKTLADLPMFYYLAEPQKPKEKKSKQKTQKSDDTEKQPDQPVDPTVN